MEQDEQFEERMVNLKTTKKRLLTMKEQDPGDCGPWYIKIAGGYTYTCRICYVGSPTQYPYEECIQLPN